MEKLKLLKKARLILFMKVIEERMFKKGDRIFVNDTCNILELINKKGKFVKYQNINDTSSVLLDMETFAQRTFILLTSSITLDKNYVFDKWLSEALSEEKSDET
ncbi:MAG: hypothetical protein ACTSV5_04330 [Promethearchaeota archaeon]